MSAHEWTVGQPVIIERARFGPGYDRTEAVVVKVTRTQVVVESVRNQAGGAILRRFAKATGREVGSSGYRPARVTPATQEVLEALRQEKARTRMIHRLDGTSWKSMSDDVLRAVCEVLDKDAEPSPLVPPSGA